MNLLFGLGQAAVAVGLEHRGIAFDGEIIVLDNRPAGKFQSNSLKNIISCRGPTAASMVNEPLLPSLSAQLILTSSRRQCRYAHGKGKSLVGAAGVSRTGAQGGVGIAQQVFS
jgi:hypothetical protein